jgi:outer membrane protein TolC
MRQLTAELGEACQQVTLARQSVAVAEESLRISEDHYRAGIIALSDLLETRNLLQQARDRYVEAAAEYCVKQAEWKQVNE